MGDGDGTGEVGETNLAGPWGLCLGFGALCEGQWETAVTWRLEGLKKIFFYFKDYVGSSGE